MIIVFTHTDLRLYWLARLEALSVVLAERGDRLEVVEIAGKGSPYSFAGPGKGTEAMENWMCLYPDCRMEDIRPREASRSLYSKLDELSPDVVISGAPAFTSGATAVQWARDHHRPVVVFDNARRQDVPRPWWVRFVKWRFYCNTDAMLIPALSHAPDYCSWGIRKDRIFFGVNVVNNEFFQTRSNRARRKCSDILSDLRLPERFIAVVGRQIAIKNFSSVIRSFHGIPPPISHGWSLVFVGDGPELDANRDLAEELGVEVQFIPFLSQDDLCAIYGLADALILPSWNETWGLVVNEAMACGLPVLVSECCGCASTLVEENRNGLTFNPGDIKQQSEVLCRFMRLSREAREDMGEESRLIISDWGLDRFVDGVLQAIGSCKEVSRGYGNILDYVLIRFWKGRYRPV